MAIFHLHVKNISRGDGRSVVAAAAYRAGEVLRNDLEERESAFGGKRHVVFSEIRRPAGAPPWMGERAQLWNAVEARERRKDSRLAKEIECALPRELPRADSIALVRRFADMYMSAGHVVDLAIHDDPAVANPHVHFLMTLRKAGEGGLGDKIKSADALQFVTEARARWAKLTNEALGLVGAGVEVDHRSLKAQGIERPPTEHRGVDRAERLRRRSRRDDPAEVLAPEPGRTEGLAPDEAAGQLPQEDHGHHGRHHAPGEGGQGTMADARRGAEDLQARLARLRELPQEDAGRVYPALIDAAVALSAGDEDSARAALERAEASVREALALQDDLRAVPDPDGAPIPLREARQAEDAMLAAMEHSKGPDAEARAALRAEASRPREPIPPRVPWQAEIGDGDWLDQEIARGISQLESDRAREPERAFERPRGRDGV